MAIWVLDKNYKLGLHHEATPETRQQLIGCLFGVWLVFFGHTVKVLTLTTIGTVAAVLAFSTGCSQSKIDALNTQLDDVRTALDGCRVDLADAKEAQKVAEDKKALAENQAERAKVNLGDAQQQLSEAKRKQKEAEMKMAAAQDQSETAYVNLHKVQQQLAEQKQRVGQLQRVHSLKMAEYEAFVAKTAQALAAKDKKISELSAPVK